MWVGFLRPEAETVGLRQGFDRRFFLAQPVAGRGVFSAQPMSILCYTGILVPEGRVGCHESIPLRHAKLRCHTLQGRSLDHTLMRMVALVPWSISRACCMTHASFVMCSEQTADVPPEQVLEVEGCAKYWPSSQDNPLVGNLAS